MGARELPVIQWVLREYEVVENARGDMEAASADALERIRAIYGGVDMPPLIEVSDSHATGAILPELDEAWAAMSNEERLVFLEAVYDDVTMDWPPEDRPDITYQSTSTDHPDGVEKAPRDADPLTSGVYRRGSRDITLNFDYIDADSDLSDPSAGPVATLVHELEHAQQHRLRDQYDVIARNPDLVEEIRSGQVPDPFRAEGSTLDAVERDKFANRSDNDEYCAYKSRPGEMAARQAGLEYLERFTTEKLEELQP